MDQVYTLHLMVSEPAPAKSFGRYISRLNVYKNIYLSRALEPYGLGSGQYIFLLFLYRMEGASQDEITEKLMVDKATTARAMKKLETEGYVTRIRDEEDRRVHHLHVTEKGLKFKPILKTILDEWTSGLTRGLPEDEKEYLLDLLSKLERNAEGMV